MGGVGWKGWGGVVEVEGLCGRGPRGLTRGGAEGDSLALAGHGGREARGAARPGCSEHAARADDALQQDAAGPDVPGQHRGGGGRGAEGHGLYSRAAVAVVAVGAARRRGGVPAARGVRAAGGDDEDGGRGRALHAAEERALRRRVEPGRGGLPADLPGEEPHDGPVHVHSARPHVHPAAARRLGGADRRRGGHSSGRRPRRQRRGCRRPPRA